MGYRDELNQKKTTYEDILKQRLDNLDKDYALLKMQVNHKFKCQ